MTICIASEPLSYNTFVTTNISFSNNRKKRSLSCCPSLDSLRAFKYCCSLAGRSLRLPLGSGTGYAPGEYFPALDGPAQSRTSDIAARRSHIFYQLASPAVVQILEQSRADGWHNARNSSKPICRTHTQLPVSSV